MVAVVTLLILVWKVLVTTSTNSGPKCGSILDTKSMVIPTTMLTTSIDFAVVIVLLDFVGEEEYDSIHRVIDS